LVIVDRPAQNVANPLLLSDSDRWILMRIRMREVCPENYRFDVGVTRLPGRACVIDKTGDRLNDRLIEREHEARTVPHHFTACAIPLNSPLRVHGSLSFAVATQRVSSRRLEPAG
jgi:hypothetical protein